MIKGQLYINYDEYLEISSGGGSALIPFNVKGIESDITVDATNSKMTATSDFDASITVNLSLELFEYDRTSKVGLWIAIFKNSAPIKTFPISWTLPYKQLISSPKVSLDATIATGDVLEIKLVNLSSVDISVITRTGIFEVEQVNSGGHPLYYILTKNLPEKDMLDIPSDDAQSITEAGYYKVTGSTTNVPVTGKGGSIAVSYYGSIIMYMLYQNDDNDMYISSNVAHSWTRISGIEDFESIINQLIYGVVTWVSGLTFDVSYCRYYIQGVVYTSAATSKTLDAAHATLDRIDVIYVDDSGSVGVLKGTAATNPAKPIVDPITQLELTQILIPAGSTTPGGITDELVYDENTGTPTEWATSSVAVPGVTVNFTDTSDPYSGTNHISISGTGTINGGNCKFTDTATHDITGNILYFYLKTSGAWKRKAGLQISFYNGATLIKSTVMSKSTQMYGFDDADTSWQKVAIDLDTLGSVSADALCDVIVIEAVKSWVNGVYIYLDKIVLQSGIVLPPVDKYHLLTQNDEFRTSFPIPSDDAANITHAGNYRVASTTSNMPVTGYTGVLIAMYQSAGATGLLYMFLRDNGDLWTSYDKGSNWTQIGSGGNLVTTDDSTRTVLAIPSNNCQSITAGGFYKVDTSTSNTPVSSKDGIIIASYRSSGTNDIYLLYLNEDGDLYTSVDLAQNWSVVGGGGSSPLTTKGDIYTFGTADARLPIGTDGQILEADSSESLGVKWGAGVSGLEKITEGGNTGWRLRGRNTANYGDIGSEAVDISFSSGASTTRGATGSNAICAGKDNIAGGNYAFVAGYNNNLPISGYNEGCSVFGSSNTLNYGGKYNTVAGYNNTTNSGVDYGFVSGKENTLTADYAAAFGISNSVGYGSFAVGYQNTISNTFGAAIGKANNVSGQVGMGFGYSNTVSGTSAIALGKLNNATALSSIAFGESCQAVANYSVSCGYGGYSSGIASFTCGHRNRAWGDYSWCGGGGGGATSNIVDAVGSFMFCYNSGTAHKYNKGDYSAILGGYDNSLSSAATRSAIIGGNAIAGTLPDTVYLPATKYTPQALPTGLGTADAGLVVFDSSASKLKCWGGTSWNALW